MVEPSNHDPKQDQKPDTKLDEYAAQASSEHAAITQAFKDAKTANHKIVGRAIELGQLLSHIRDLVGHGQWLPWLKAKCPDIKERTAQRYMKLAEKKTELQTKIKSDTMTDFAADTIPPDMTLAAAFRLIEDKSGGGQDTPSGAYEKVEQRLIKKLKDLDVPTAEASVANTIKSLNTQLTVLKAAELDKTKKAS